MMNHRNIKLLRWFNFFTDFKLYTGIGIIYFAHVTGSYALGMSIFSIVMISAAFFEIPTGVFSDFLGRRRTLILGAASAVIHSLFYAIGQSYWIFAIGALFEGLSRSFYSGNNEALAYDSLFEIDQEDKFAEVLGKLSAMFQAALAISAVLGGFLATWSFPFIFWLSVIPQIGCLILAFFIREPKVHSGKSGNIYQHLKEAYFNFWHNKKLRLLSTTSILGFGFGEATYAFLPAFYNSLWPLWAIGFARTLSSILGTVSFHFGGKFIRKFGEMKLIITDNIMNRIVNIFSLVFPTVLSPLLMSSTSFFYGITTTAKSTLMQKEFEDEKRATMGSLNSFAGSICLGITSIILGFTADTISPAKALLLLQLFQFINLYLYWKLFKHHT